MSAVKLETKEPVKTGVKKTFEMINGQKVPVYKIPAGMSGSGSKPFVDEEEETESSYNKKSPEEEKMNYELQKFYDNGRSDDPYIEEKITDILALDVEEELFDTY